MKLNVFLLVVLSIEDHESLKKAFMKDENALILKNVAKDCFDSKTLISTFPKEVHELRALNIHEEVDNLVSLYLPNNFTCETLNKFSYMNFDNSNSFSLDENKNNGKNKHRILEINIKFDQKENLEYVYADSEFEILFDSVFKNFVRGSKYCFETINAIPISDFLYDWLNEQIAFNFDLSSFKERTNKIRSYIIDKLDQINLKVLNQLFDELCEDMDRQNVNFQKFVMVL